MRHNARGWLAVSIFAATVCAPACPSVDGRPAENPIGAALELEYHLRLERPSTHLVEVEIVAGKVAEPTLDFAMPAWSPGRYAIYDFAKNVQEFEASGAQGQPLPWMQPDKQTWRVDASAAGGTIRARYKVFANDLSGTFSQFDPSHANLNGASIFMYVAGHARDPLTLTADALPAAGPAWKMISGYTESAEQKSFRVPSYDLLVDTPMEISPECSLTEFSEGGKTIRVAVHNYTEDERESSAAVGRLIDGVKKIVRSEMAMMPEPDFERYTFIFHFAPDIAEGDGMEHLNSTQIIIRGKLSEENLPEALEDAAHEFFHLWNVKRLRPAALGPFDYAREDYTRSLWFAEGMTTYYSYVHLYRSGLWSRKEFLNRLANEIRALELEPGRLLMSAESSSFHAWFYDRSPQMQETNFANTTISYYNKGALLGMLLDLEIRARARGERSLDDVLRALYHDFYETPARQPTGAAAVIPLRGTDVYGRGRGYEEKELLDAVNAVAGGDFTSFFGRYVRGTEPLPYAEAFAAAGLELRITAPDATPSLGVLTRHVDRGERITVVRPGSAADRAGLSRDDLLISADELSLADTQLKDRLRMYPPGAEVPFTVERHGRRQRIWVRLDPPVKSHYAIEDLPGASAEQINIRSAWPGGRR